MNYSTEVKQKLLSIITKMDSYYWLFTKHPKTDFSRKKKWSFEEVMKFMLTMEGKALRDELLEYFEFDNTTPSNSSFNQRRAQILPTIPKMKQPIFKLFLTEKGTTYCI